MRILALDVGERRIGMAISDPLGMLASPFGTLEVDACLDVADRLRAIVNENNVQELIVGLPIRTDGSEGVEAERVRGWAAETTGGLGVPVVFVDERFTTRQASANLRAQGQDSRRMRGRLDAAAAAVLLQSYLDGRRGDG